MSESEVEGLLFDCAYDGDLDGVRHALDLGADVNAIDSSGRTALHIAAKEEHLPVIEHLLDQKAEIDKREDYTSKMSALMIATNYGNVEAMKLLIKRGANVKISPDPGNAGAGNLALPMLAVHALKNADAVWDVLLDPDSGLPAEGHPAHPDNKILVISAVGATTGADSELLCDSQVLAALARKGVRYGLHDTEGYSVLHKLMKQVGIRTEDTGVALHITEAIKHLLEAGVSPFVADIDGYIAYGGALHYPRILELFRDACKPLAQCAEQFDPKLDSLIDGNGKLTELAMYCCFEEKLGDVLSPGRWSDREALIQTQQALSTQFSAYYRNHFSAELDTSPHRRAIASKLHPLRRYTGHNNHDPGVKR